MFSDCSYITCMHTKIMAFYSFVKNHIGFTTGTTFPLIYVLGFSNFVKGKMKCWQFPAPHFCTTQHPVMSNMNKRRNKNKGVELEAAGGGI
jgi:hypothetical protein